LAHAGIVVNGGGLVNYLKNMPGLKLQEGAHFKSKKLLAMASKLASAPPAPL
jgi:hypothetical protein